MAESWRLFATGPGELVNLDIKKKGRSPPVEAGDCTAGPASSLTTP
jgi:hypothetical protein